MAISLADLRRRENAQRSGKKIPKDEADYQKSSAPTKHSCGICAMFRQPSQCTLVEGFIRPEMGCKFFERK